MTGSRFGEVEGTGDVGEMRRGRGVFEGATRICDVSVGEEGGGDREWS